MQDISQDTLNEAAKLAQSARITLWEIDLTQSGGDRYFFCNEANEKGEAVTWQGQKYDVYPVEGSGFEMNGKGAAARPSLKVPQGFRPCIRPLSFRSTPLHLSWISAFL